MVADAVVRVRIHVAQVRLVELLEGLVELPLGEVLARTRKTWRWAGRCFLLRRRFLAHALLHGPSLGLSRRRSCCPPVALGAAQAGNPVGHVDLTLDQRAETSEVRGL